MYVEAHHVDTLSLIADAYRDDVPIQGDRLREERVTLYYPPDAELPRAEQANL